MSVFRDTPPQLSEGAELLVLALAARDSAAAINPWRADRLRDLCCLVGAPLISAPAELAAR